MRVKTFFGCLLLVGCVKHVELNTGRSSRPVLSADHMWAYYVDGPSDWTVVSKVGPEKATKFLCPKDSVCTTEIIGTMYRVRRIH